MLVRSDVKGEVAIVPRRAEISAGTRHCGQVWPQIRGGWATLLPLLVLSSLMGVQTLRAPWADCWEPASLEAACQESACLGAAFLSMAAF